MSTGSSIPVQVLQGSSKGMLFGEGQALFCDVGLTAAAVFAPFTGDDPEATATAAGDSSTERDLLLMEHLPTVRYLARRIHERLPDSVNLDDLEREGPLGRKGHHASQREPKAQGGRCRLHSSGQLRIP